MIDLVSVDGLRALERQIEDLRDRIDNVAVARDGLVAQLRQVESATLPRIRQLLRRSAAYPGLATGDSRSKSRRGLRCAVACRARAQTRRYCACRSAIGGWRLPRRRSLPRSLDKGADLITLQQLTHEAEATRVLYQYFPTRFNEIAAQHGIHQADSRILSEAVVPLAPPEPRKSLILAMSGMLGLIVGVGIILLREAKNTGFRTARDLEQATSYTVLG